MHASSATRSPDVVHHSTAGNLLKVRQTNQRNAEVWEAAREAGLLPKGKGSEQQQSVTVLAEKLSELAATSKTRAYYRHAVLEGMPGHALVVNHHELGGFGSHEGASRAKTADSSVGADHESIHIHGNQGSVPAVQRQLQPVSKATESTAMNIPPAGLVCFVEDAVRVVESDGSVTVQVQRVGGTEGEATVQYATKDQQAKAGKDYEAASGSIVFKSGEMGPINLVIKVTDDDDLEKDETFTVVLSEATGGCIFDSATDGGVSSTICTVTIANDDERATRFAKAMALLQLDMDELDLAEASWAQQLRDAFNPPTGSLVGVFVFVLSSPWKLLFALAPPPLLWGGWPCFCSSLFLIGFQVLLISDFATQMGCHMGLTPAVTAITFVALGTSLPDLFASKQAAIGDKTADNSIGNVTGSNSVNVFFGLGMPWLMGALYWETQGASAEWIARYPDLYAQGIRGGFVVRSGDLGFSVIVFGTCALLTIITILFRRPTELGGKRASKYATAVFFVSMWLTYVILSTLVSVGTLTVNM